MFLDNANIASCSTRAESCAGTTVLFPANRSLSISVCNWNTNRVKLKE